MQPDAERGETGLSRELLVLGGVIVLGAIASILDATIVNVAVPTLGERFGASIGSIQWVMTAYLLAFATVIPLSGWLARRFGARRVWVAALVVFMAGSVLAGRRGRSGRSCCSAWSRASAAA